MTYHVLVDHVYFVRDEKRGEDGAVWYLILGEPKEGVTCPIHPGREHHYERQAFRLGGNGYRLDATDQEKQEDKANVWGWDGNREAPTILPSFLAAKDRPYLMHSYLTAGKLALCGDSTVVVDPSILSCWDS